MTSKKSYKIDNSIERVSLSSSLHKIMGLVNIKYSYGVYFMYDFKKKVGLYNIAIEKNNIIYSIDMLRLKCYINYNVYNELDFYIRTYYNYKIKRFWISDRPQCYKYNYNIEVVEGKSFWFGFCHNSEEKLPERLEPQYMFTIEFNPNKLKDDKLLMYILNLSGKWYILKYDLAIDLHVNILDIIFDKSRKEKI